jgi:putative DNA primase/helicase
MSDRHAHYERIIEQEAAQRAAWSKIEPTMLAACVKLRRAVRLGKYHEALEAIRPIYEQQRAEDWDDEWNRSFAFWLNDAMALANTSASRHVSLQHWFYGRTTPTEEMFEEVGYSTREGNRAVEAMLTADIPAEEKRAEILVKAGDLTEAIDQAEAALIDACLGLYQMNGQIVRLSYVDVPGEREKLRALPIEPEHIAELLGRVVHWSRFDVRKDEEVTTGVPANLAKTYVARGPAEWKLPRLNGIITAPTLRADATPILTYGYDDKTGLFLDCDDEWAPWSCGSEHLDEEEILDQAIDASEILDELLVGFPFVAEVDRSVAISAILTAAVRRNLPTAPMHAFTAPTPGSGKSYLVDLASMIATGRMSSALSWSSNDDENQKRIDAALIEGASTIAFDNVKIPLDGARLNQILTQTIATARVLGESRNVEVQCKAFITANGNNLQIADDLTRRTLLCRLDSGLDRPELRQFESNPIEMVKANHDRYIRAALTMLRCYRISTWRNHPPVPLGSFEAWSDWVRAALIWLGYDDPVESIEHSRENDPVRSDITAVMEQWNLAFGDRRMTAAAIIKAMPISTNSELREAFLSVAGVSGAVNSGRLGKWLRSTKDRLIGQFKIENAGKVQGAVVWRLVGGQPAVATVDGVPLSSLQD